MPKTKVNKSAFHIFYSQIGEELEQYGYKPHPAYQPGWEPAHQECISQWLKSDLSKGIDEVSMTWKPKGLFLRISRSVVHPNFDDSISFHDLPTDPVSFSDYWLKYPFVRFTLLPRPRRFWQTRKMDLRLTRKDLEQPDSSRNVMREYVIPYLSFLLEAKEGLARNEYIITDSFDITHSAN